MDTLYLVLLGGPGAGKGTQADRLSERLGIPQVSTGNLFRDNLKRQTELGLLAKGYMDRGELVPDQVTVRMLHQRLLQPDCARGAILDGFPRTEAQADALEHLLADLGSRLAAVLYIQVPDDILLARLSGRWTCKVCGTMYHQLFSPPQQTGICDKCGGELYQRPDDTPATQERRIKVYLAETAPLIEYYRNRGLLFEVDGRPGIEEVQAQLLAAIKARVQ
ncbi:MAG: adenylate kinase [Anaerolineae bacterium]|nr:adenylate kinase [Anaerolineae bacterium]